MTRHFGNQAPAQEARALREADLYFEQGAAFCRTMTNRWLDLVEQAALPQSDDMSCNEIARRRA
jgi:hypothetical protein